MKIETIPTNNVFHELLYILNIHKEIGLIIEIFQAGGYAEISKAKIKSWQTRTSSSHRFRPMPREALEAFFLGIKEKEDDLFERD